MNIIRIVSRDNTYRTIKVSILIFLSIAIFNFSFKGDTLKVNAMKNKVNSVSATFISINGTEGSDVVVSGAFQVDDGTIGYSVTKNSSTVNNTGETYTLAFTNNTQTDIQVKFSKRKKLKIREIIRGGTINISIANKAYNFSFDKLDAMGNVLEENFYQLKRWDPIPD